MKLDIKNLEVSVRDQTLVSNINLTVEAGKTLALVGASGSGKSVTCASIFDLLPAGLKAKGDILINGEPVSPKNIRGNTISCIMQNPSSAFNPLQTMQQHGLETILASGQSYKREKLIQAMKDAGLEDCDELLTYYPFQMSGGMLQRMMIALALVTGAPFLVADEPTTDLDLIVQSHILSRIEAISRERNLGVLLVTHDFGVVARLADDVAVMSEGQIVERGDVHQIFNAPQHPVTQSLLNAHLSLYKEVSNG